jgi:hypothetical protein
MRKREEIIARILPGSLIMTEGVQRYLKQG